jgi:hypothetical protein
MIRIRQQLVVIALLAAFALLCVACHRSAGSGLASDADTDTDTDSDSDSDVDTDSDSDNDTDSDSDSDSDSDTETDIDTEEVVESYGGDLIWAVGAGGINQDRATSVTALADGSTFVVGEFGGDATFGDGDPNETVLSTTGDNDGDIFIARYNPDGTLEWASRAGGTDDFADDDVALAATALPDDSVLVTGYIESPSTFGLSDTHTIDIVAGSSDVFVVRFTAEGEVSWVKSAGGDDHEEGTGIVGLADGSAVVVGVFCGTAVFGLGETNETELDATLTCSNFIARFAADGLLEWAAKLATAGNVNGIDSTGDDWVYAVGEFSETSVFGQGDGDETSISPTSGESDIYLVKYGVDGDFVWATTAGGVDGDIGWGIVALADGGVAITGRFVGEAVFGEGEPGETNLVSAGDQDVFVALYGSDGVLAWARRGGGIEYDVGIDIAAYPDGSLIAVGGIDGNAVFGQGEPNETLLLSAGWVDMFVAKYEPDGDLAWARAELGSGGGNPFAGYGVAGLSGGDFFVAGFFNDEATFGQLEPNETTLYSNGDWSSDDMFLARYSQ